jgi:hypothetical protein
MSARRAGNNRHSHPSRGSNARMHNTLRQISARPFQRLTVGASGSDRPVATGETPRRVAARAGGMPRYFPLAVGASPSRPMNLGGTPPPRSWGHLFTSQPVEEEQTGVVTRRGRAASTLGAQATARSVPSRSRVLNDGALRAEVDVLRFIVRSLLLLSLDNKSRRLDFMYYRGRREHLVCRRAETGEAG